MIDGLKLTVSGNELRTLLERRMRRHEEQARWWTHETMRTVEDQTEDAPLLPDHMCENEAERHTWRASVLGFIRDHVDTAETYRLGAADLDFGELLPERPGSVGQNEYEERTRVGFALERLVKSLDGLAALTAFMERRSTSARDERGATGETIDEDDEFRTTRLDIEGGPEIIRIERKET